MRVLVSGASGLVGHAVCGRLEERRDAVVRLIREGTGGVAWNPKTGRFDRNAAEGFDAVVHLAGENVASGRWSASRKKEIRRSRVEGTRILANGLAGLERPPRILVCASAVGFYGSRGDEQLSEASSVGRGFLAEVCRDWEAACEPASERGIRVVGLRIGLVLSADGGALARMLPVFRLGLGGRIGDGRQWMSWITLDDLVRVVELAIDDEQLAGPVNAVSPSAVRNTHFTRTLAAVLGRPALFAVPSAVLRLLLGEMADEMLLSSTRALPQVLVERGFRFQDAELEPALSRLLSRC